MSIACSLPEDNETMGGEMASMARVRAAGISTECLCTALCWLAVCRGAVADTDRSRHAVALRGQPSRSSGPSTRGATLICMPVICLAVLVSGTFDANG